MGLLSTLVSEYHVTLKRLGVVKDIEVWVSEIPAEPIWCSVVIIDFKVIWGHPVEFTMVTTVKRVPRSIDILLYCFVY